MNSDNTDNDTTDATITHDPVQDAETPADEPEPPAAGDGDAPAADEQEATAPTDGGPGDGEASPAAGSQIEHVDTASAADVKQAQDAVEDALNRLARTAARHGGEWGTAVASFALASLKQVPALPTLRDFTPEQRADAVGSYATVKFAAKPGKYLILGIEEDNGRAVVVQPSTATLLTATFSTVTVDPAGRVFDAGALE